MTMRFRNSLSARSLNRRTFAGGAALGAASLATMRVPLVEAQDRVKVTWSSWGNTGEVENLQKFNDAFNEMQDIVEAEYLPTPNDGYAERLLTQLNGGTAPTMFYVNDGQASTLIKNGAVLDVTDLLSSDASQSRPEDFAGDLWGPTRTPDGRLYGVTVDCNPLVLWFNKTLLQDAGVTDLPTDLYEAGNWTWDAFQSMLDAVHESGKTPFILSGWWALRYSWVTANGGSIYTDGKFSANADAKSMEAFQWLADNINAGKIVFAGSLPEGQGDDAMFMSSQLAFVSVGRWGLPLFRQNADLDCDIVPYPTNTGNKIEPAGVAVAYWMMNAKQDHLDEAFTFYTYFVSPEGQAARLSAGGNAVPSIRGVEDVILSDDQPEHKQYFLDARDIGYGPPAEEVGTPGLSAEMDEAFEKLWLDPGDVQSALDSIAEMANSMIDENAG